MKKNIHVLLFLTLTTSFLNAQNSNLNGAVNHLGEYENYNDSTALTKARNKIDIARENEATKDKPKTWHFRGKIYLASFEKLFKDELNKKTETDLNKKIVNAYLAVPSDFLNEAFKSFEKCIELDVKKTYSVEIENKLKVIADHYNDKGYSCITNNKYPEATSSYEKAYDLKSKFMHVIDTAIINNIALAYSYQKDYKNAEVYFNKLIELNYFPENNFVNIYQMYNEAGDTSSARRVLESAIVKFPESYNLLLEKINIYLKAGKAESVISNIRQAIAKKPDSHELYLVLGQTYNKMAFPQDANGRDLAKPTNYDELIKKAELDLNKSIEIKPDYFEGLYSLGIFYNNVGADILKRTEKMKDPKKIKTEEDKADKYFVKALPILEKAHSIRTDMDVMKTLRQLYLRTGQSDTEKFKKLNEQIKIASN